MRKIKTKLGAVAATTLAVCGVATVVAAPAHADGHAVYKVSNNNGAYGEFRSYGEVTCATDTRADGHGAATELEFKYNGTWLFTDLAWARGRGKTMCVSGNDFREGTSIRVRTCLAEPREAPNLPRRFSCSPWKYGTA